MVDLVTKRLGNTLVPATPFDAEQLDRLRPGRPFRTTVVFSRSVQHLRFYRALVSVAAEGLGLHADTLHANLKLKCGLIERILLGDAGPLVQLRSTAFKSMDEADFTSYVALAIEVLFRDFLPGVKREDVFKRVEEMVGPRP